MYEISVYKMFDEIVDINGKVLQRSERIEIYSQVVGEREKSIKMALYMLRDGLQGLWFFQQLSPGYAPLMPFMIADNEGNTVSQLWAKTSEMGNPSHAKGTSDRYEYLHDHRIINGTPGTLSDSAVRSAIHTVEHGNYTRDEKYELLDNLTFAAHNNHARGTAAGVLDEISDAIGRVQTDVRR